VALEGGDVHRVCQAAQDLLHGEEATIIAEDRVYRVMGGVGLFDELPGGALVVEGTADLVTKCAGHGRGKAFADLAVGACLTASERPPVVIVVPSPGIRATIAVVSLGSKVTGSVADGAASATPKASTPIFHAQARFARGWSQVGATMLLGPADDCRGDVVGTFPPTCPRLASRAPP